jgi:DinB superfamily
MTIENKIPEAGAPEPWLRGTLSEVPAVPRGVLHALQLAKENIEHWCAGLTDEELNARPAGIAPVAFHVRHIARSLDRLLTYAEGNPLTAEQRIALRTELDPAATAADLFAEFQRALENGAARVRAFDVGGLEQARRIGQQQLPTTLGGLLVHVADHTQRHAGQAITTAKLAWASRKQT